MTAVAAAATGSELKATIDIAAPPAQVWALVTDVRRMSSWSPQVARTFVFGGPVRLGTHFLNVNHQGWKRWPTNARVVRFSPHTDFAFRIVENRSIWSFALEEVEGGTRVTQRREAPDGISAVSNTLVRLVLGGQEPFVAGLLEGMSQTLERMRAELEG